MAFPRKLLAPGEEIVLESNPNWSILLSRATVFLAVLAASVAVLVAWKSAPLWVGYVLLGFSGVALLWFLGRVITWRSTSLVLTTSRVVYRTGVVRRLGREIPLDRIQDVTYEQSIVERMLGAGSLKIESAGASGDEPFPDIRHPAVVQSLINRLLTEGPAYRAGHGGGLSGGGGGWAQRPAPPQPQYQQPPAPAPQQQQYQQEPPAYPPAQPAQYQQEPPAYPPAQPAQYQQEPPAYPPAQQQQYQQEPPAYPPAQPAQYQPAQYQPAQYQPAQYQPPPAQPPPAQPPPAQPPPVQPAPSPQRPEGGAQPSLSLSQSEQLAHLTDLLRLGVITDAEFEQKRREIIGQ